MKQNNFFLPCMMSTALLVCGVVHAASHNHEMQQQESGHQQVRLTASVLAILNNGVRIAQDYDTDTVRAVWGADDDENSIKPTVRFFNNYNK